MKYVAVLLVGILIGYFFQPKPQIETKLAPEVSNKFQSLIDNEGKNFALQTDADAKLKAAEELYGKMMLLLLANLNLKSEVQFVTAEKPVVEVEKTEVVVTEKSSSTPTESVDVAATPAAKPKTEKQTPQQIYDKFRSAHYVDSFKSKERRLLGQFIGILNHVRPTGRKDSVRMEFNLVQEGKKLSGNTLVAMTDPDGKEYSKNAGSGGNRALKINPDEEDSYYVDASPTSFFILSFKNFPRINGQYFEKGKLVGNVHMKKIAGDM